MHQVSEMDYKANILISPSYIYALDLKQWKDRRPYPPYGTLVAASLLRNNDYDIKFIDSHLSSGTKQIKNEIGPVHRGYLVIYDDGFNYLTKMCLTAMRQVALDLISHAKKLDYTVILYNSDASDHVQTYLEGGADFIILGEGELTLLELLEYLVKGKGNLDQIAGIAYASKNQIMKTNARPVIQDVDLLPDAAWDLIDLSPYKKIWYHHHGYFSINLATTRGCPFKCNWCAKPIYGNRYNSRSPERVVKEIKYLIDHYDIQHIWMADDIFGLNKKWMTGFKNEMIHQQVQVQYKIQSRADLLTQENYVEDLYQSGCKEVWIGAESGSQKILNDMDKGITLAQIKQATELLKSKSIQVGYFLQFGYLNETMEDIKATIDMLLHNMPDDLGISISYPLPGTAFFDKVKERIGDKQNWKDSDDLDILYHGNYSRTFYKRLHRFVHKLFRQKQGILNLAKIFQGHTKLNKPILKSIVYILYYLPATWIEKIRLRKLNPSFQV